MSDELPPTASLRGAVDLTSLVNRQQVPAPATDPSGATPDVGGLIVDATDATFSSFIELSMRVPVVVDLWAEWCGPCKQLSPVLEKIVREYAGRFVLVKVDVDQSPQLAQAFQAQSIPTVAALVGGRPVGLFTGAIPEAQVREVIEQLLALAAQNRVTGTVDAAPADDDESAETPEEPAAEPLPPLHQEAYDAIERGDYVQAISAYSTAIAQDPHDRLAVAGLAQVQLLSRLDGVSAQEVRDAAAQDPRNRQAALAVADLDLSGGHVEDAFDRLLSLFPSVDEADKDAIRQRLLEYFEVVGTDDPRVTKARARLTSLLY